MTDGGPGTRDALLRAVPLPQRLPLLQDGLRLGAGLGAVRDHPGASRCCSCGSRGAGSTTRARRGRAAARMSDGAGRRRPGRAGGRRARARPAGARAGRAGRLRAADRRRRCCSRCPSSGCCRPRSRSRARRSTFPPRWIPAPVRLGELPARLDGAAVRRLHRATRVVTALAALGRAAALLLAGRLRLRPPPLPRARRSCSRVLLATMMLPSQVTLIPHFILFRTLGWLDTLLPLIVPTFFGDAVLHLPAAPVLPDAAARAGRRRAHRRRQPARHLLAHHPAAVDAGAGDGRASSPSSTTGTTSSGR